jgi:lipopolysaccharide export system protein LptA
MVRRLPAIASSLAVASMLLIPLRAPGLASDADQPVHLHANTISIDQTTGLSHYRGKVVLRQGTLRITADRATAVHKGRKLERIDAAGSPATARQQLEQAPHLITLRGQTLHYNAQARRVRAAGRVTVARGRDRVHADEVTYDLNRKELRATGKDGRQVKATLWREQESRP